MKDFINKYKEGLRAYRLNQKQAEINYYENLFDPEHAHNTGFSTFQRLEMAKAEQERIRQEAVPRVTKMEIGHYLRIQSIDCYRTASQFSDNNYLKTLYLRKSVSFIQELFILIPELKIYSKKAIVNPNLVIKL